MEIYYIPVWTRWPICSSDIVIDLPFSILTFAEDGKHFFFVVVVVVVVVGLNWNNIGFFYTSVQTHRITLYYRSDMLNMVNLKYHLFQSFYKICFCQTVIIFCLKWTVNSNSTSFKGKQSFYPLSILWRTFKVWCISQCKEYLNELFLTM